MKFIRVVISKRWCHKNTFIVNHTKEKKPSREAEFFWHTKKWHFYYQIWEKAALHDFILYKISFLFPGKKCAFFCFLLKLDLMKDQYCHPKCCHDLFAEEKVLSKTFLAGGKKHLLLSVMKSFFQEPQKVYSWGFSMWQKKLLLLYPILYILSYINKWQTFMPTTLALLGKQVNAKRASHFFVLIAAVFATIHSFITHLFGMENITFSQTGMIKCSRSILQPSWN